MTPTGKSDRTRKRPIQGERATHRPRSSWLSWAAVLIPAAALIAIAGLGTNPNRDGQPVAGTPAPAFTLPATDGASYALEDVLVDGPALLYFSMGPGCDGCFAQIPEITEDLAVRGITLVSVMVDPAPLVSAEAKRFGIAGPILIDADRSVSEAYGMIGIYGHGDRPSHSFALVDGDGHIAAVKHYAQMFVPSERLFTDLDLAA